MSERCFVQLQAYVMARQSAEWLTLGELLKLAESCEATAHVDRTQAWAADFAIPMIRELGQRLERSGESPEGTNHKDIIETARQLRTSQRAFESARQLKIVKANDHQSEIKRLQYKLDNLLANSSQTLLFTDTEEPELKRKA
ncbi:hypothetical protein [Aureliella helgolandensis]|uniref:Uncharacterized protein n=1 Tax=Aureliella helgolandensis TaxID=2527968 RepID=A0A518G4D3_9BACT|nr:hypothetical protein [Aureliella helgolandensis]QDV23457.1 hypothetical protein Q31a_17550 [Aureliella helgolandensis]